MSSITGYHAHVYFGPESREQARALCEAAANTFGLSVGRMHDGPVGPHPRPSCQLAFATEQLPEVIPWLIMNGRRAEGSHRPRAVARTFETLDLSQLR